MSLLNIIFGFETSIQSSPSTLTNIQHLEKAAVRLGSRIPFLIKISIRSLMLSLKWGLFENDCHAVAL